LWQGQSSAIEARLPGAAWGIQGIAVHAIHASIKRHVGAKTVYALTNNRAVVLELDGGVIKVLEQWPIGRATASVINRIEGTRALSWRETWESSRRGLNMGDKTVGDVLFFNHGRVVLNFSQVEDPDQVIELTEKIAMSKQKGV